MLVSISTSNDVSSFISLIDFGSRFSRNSCKRLAQCSNDYPKLIPKSCQIKPNDDSRVIIFCCRSGAVTELAYEKSNFDPDQNYLKPKQLFELRSAR